MNMRLREADLPIGEAAGARPPWWIHSIRRRRMIVAGLIVFAAAGALFWVWYTTLCGYCRQPPLPCAKPCELPARLPPPSPRN